MRSFLATSNHQYVQDVVLKPGQYTFSALVKSAGSYAFALMIGGVWVKYDVPTSTTNWRKLKHTFTTDALTTKFSLVADYATAGTPIEVLTPMFEEGSIVSTARMHELDVLEAIAIAKQEAEDAAKAYALAQAELAQTQAEAYADGEIDAAEARAIQSAQDKVDAQALVEQQARNVLQTNLEAYADGKVSAEETARINDANAKLQAAKDYADAQANAARITAEAYADGIVTAEESARIADADAKLAEAKQHAENLDLVIRNDLDDLIGTVNTEQGKVIALENKTGAFAEPSVNPAENTLLAGSMLVGNSSGTNAGISGLGTSGSSVRLWAGETFANRSTANWLIRDDGMEEQWTLWNGQRKIVRRRGQIENKYQDILYNPEDGSTAKITTVVDGYVEEQWYKNGQMVYSVGSGGIYYVTEVAESWTSHSSKLLTSTTSQTDAELITILKNLFVFTEYRNTTYGDYAIIRIATPNMFYRYHAGQNVYSDGNKQYEKYYFNQNTSKTGTKLTDGWYSIGLQGQTEDIPPGGGYANYNFTTTVFRILSGELVESRTLTLTGNYYMHP